MFDYLKSHPESGRRFSSAVSSLEPSGRSADFLKKIFDWASLGQGTVVDVGGAKGGVAIQLGMAFADLNFVVQDLPMVVKGVVALVPESLTSQITIEAHNFFTPQAIQPTCIYFVLFTTTGQKRIA